ncbi:centrosomal protein of 164 kDa isoform X3 [Hyposmocoma kahamanoa]|uniref:centrosomal protein of 164 kDa isoform X3 n=1 Tax=Hyposmocoma kahamanoa TaxID=1477025 RepID=UPI000E6D8718|nr:centrosomal protein of 164 kDa isoform X3 [Hyposmocoma kahamanoa]
MSSPSAVVCREIFDENSQPSAEEISEYAHQLGIDPESESHLLPLAKEGLMQALPAPWKAYFDEKLQTHYYYNEETKKTQWEHPLDNIYREIVKHARDASIQDDTCASVQELLTSEENTKILERVETKVESDDDDLSTDSENHPSNIKESTLMPKRLAPLGRPPLAPLSRLDKKLGDLKISPLRRSVDNTKPLLRNISDRDLLSRPLERPKMLFKQQSEIIDLKMHVLSREEEENFSSLLSGAKVDRGLPLTGKGNMFLRMSKSDLPSPDTDKSLPLDSITKSDPPKGILREKLTDVFNRKADSVVIGRSRHSSSLDEDKKSVRFKLENLPDPTISPGSNSSSEQNEQSSIVASIPAPALPSPLIPFSPISSPPIPSVPLNPPIILSPLAARPPLPPRPGDCPREVKSVAGSDRESGESDKSPRRRVVRPPAADYIKPDLFQKNFQKISDLVRPGEIEPTSLHLEEPSADKEVRPRSPMIPQQKNKISINLMESIESETSIDSPDKEFANLDLNELDISNDKLEQKISEKNQEKDSSRMEETSEKTTSKTSNSTQNKSSYFVESISIPQIRIPVLDLTKTKLQSDSDDSKKIEDSKNSRTDSIEIKPHQVKVSPTPSIGSDLKSPRYDFNKPWSSPFSSFKPPNKAIIAPLKTSDSATSLGKTLTSPRLDGVILSQGKSSDNVVVVYQFESQENFPKPIKSPLIPDVAARDVMERTKGDERRRLELSLQKELETIRSEFAAKERKMRVELQEELREAEEKFVAEKRMRLDEQSERHKNEMEEALAASEMIYQESLKALTAEMEERRRRDLETAERQHNEEIAQLKEFYQGKLAEKRDQLEIENDRALAELREQLQANLHRERVRLAEQNRATIDALRDEHNTRITELRHDYRAEVERLRTQHACHLEELRARLASERLAPTRHDDRALQDKYRCLKEKYARLKHDVKMSIERRNKRREMSMTTGSETEKSNSHKQTQSLERCKEANETSISAVIEPEPRVRTNNNTAKYNDNETSHSESNALKSSDNNNDEWKLKRENTVPPTNITHPPVTKKVHRRAAVAFREPLGARSRDRVRDRDGAVTTDCQDSSDATTADEKPKEPINGHGRRRCFTRLKSASTSRLNYSPKRGEGWSSPLESLRQQLRKLDDLEDQFPDLACQPSYSLRYPFAELGGAGVSRADLPELEFVRHRALVEREGMRRARAVLRRRRKALRETRAELSPHRAPSEEREATELEVALHRARALLGEKEIRLQHIERALRKLTESHPPPLIQVF